MAIEEQIEEDNNIKGHVVQTRKRYQRNIDEEAELKELIAQRDALNEEQEAVKADEEEVKRALKMMPDVGKHKEGDYILDDGKQVDIKESVLRTLAEKKNLKNGQNPKDQKE